MIRPSKITFFDVTRNDNHLLRIMRNIDNPIQMRKQVKEAGSELGPSHTWFSVVHEDNSTELVLVRIYGSGEQFVAENPLALMSTPLDLAGTFINIASGDSLDRYVGGFHPIIDKFSKEVYVPMFNLAEAEYNK